jgi:predicted DNA-binding WGR domain protein
VMALPDFDAGGEREADDENNASLATGGMTEFRLVAGTSNKFWRVGVQGNDLIVEFGRVGTKGQRVVKSYDNADLARREATKLTLEKTRKGYQEFS